MVALDKPSQCGRFFRADLVQALEREAEEADCVLAVGTSMPGMSADSIAEAVAARADV